VTDIQSRTDSAARRATRILCSQCGKKEVNRVTLEDTFRRMAEIRVAWELDLSPQKLRKMAERQETEARRLRALASQREPVPSLGTVSASPATQS
jgi:hypothetical protein